MGGSGANRLIKKPQNRLLTIFFTWFYINWPGFVVLCWKMDFSKKSLLLCFTHSPLEILPKNVFEATIGKKITWDTLPQRAFSTFYWFPNGKIRLFLLHEMLCCHSSYQQKTTKNPTLNGGEGVGVWILLFSVVTLSAQVSRQSCPWLLKLMMSHVQAVEGTWICKGSYGWLRGEWVNWICQGFMVGDQEMILARNIHCRSILQKTFEAIWAGSFKIWAKIKIQEQFSVRLTLQTSLLMCHDMVLKKEDILHANSKYWYV